MLSSLLTASKTDEGKSACRRTAKYQIPSTSGPQKFVASKQFRGSFNLELQGKE